MKLEPLKTVRVTVHLKKLFLSTVCTENKKVQYDKYNNYIMKP